MSGRYIVDLESDGLLDQLTTIHSLVIKNIDKGFVFSCCDDPDYQPSDSEDGTVVRKLDVESGVEYLMELDDDSEIIGHNIQRFDIPAIQKVYPWFKPHARVVDTLVLSRLVFSDVKGQLDFALREKGQLPGYLMGAHSLESWGLRLGFHKDDYKAKAKAAGRDPWSAWWPTMQEYCERDVEVTHRLYQYLLNAWGGSLPEEAVELEHAVWELCGKIERNGFPFDEEKAAQLYSELASIRYELQAKLKSLFKPWWRASGLKKTVSKTRRVKRPDLGEVTIRRFSEKTGKELKPYRGPVLELFEEGAVYTPVELHEFQPTSRADIEDRLRKLRGWRPEVFTDSGAAKLDDEILQSLPFPEAQQLARLFTVDKRIGQLADGKQAWIKASKNGVIYHRINTNGAVTGRATHSNPNLAQVPKVKKSKDGRLLTGEDGSWGAECRELFHCPKPGWTMLGVDMSGLELRCLAHFMSFYDNGAYTTELLDGDIHTTNQNAAGLPTRDMAKTFIYGFLYGAGNAKIGSIVGKGAQAGGQLKKRFLAKTPALKKLRERVDSTLRERDYILGLDGRRLPIRKKHAALNTLLQSAGALTCKKWMVLFEQKLHESGYTHSWDGDYVMVAWVHDELQLMCREDIAEDIGRIAVECCALAGEAFNFRCPLTGDANLGSNWRDTH
ncbi:DNA polymerase [Pyruvatibacter mobilis]|uniref:DNA polymerase n=1 Tax=Pyruvatibacter mobilis TaxID=1712261 RepID=UPI003BA949C2